MPNHVYLMRFFWVFAFVFIPLLFILLLPILGNISRTFTIIANASCLYEDGLIMRVFTLFVLCIFVFVLVILFP